MLQGLAGVVLGSMDMIRSSIMKILTKAIEKKLLANGAAKAHNHKPVLKLFGGAACTWLITEMDPEDNDRLFGLCDLGMGTPELGYVSLKELMTIRFQPFGLGIERDRFFEADKTLHEYTEESRRNGRIIA
jgi:hypothetical protein